MSEAFDPYRKWLGIPPAEQPPNHYRLLGIALYEDDPDVIQHAADRQMVHLRTFQSGKSAAHSQRILNEVSAARICLLNAEKKAAYDTQLKQQLAPPVTPAAAPPAAPPPAPPPPAGAAPPPASPPAASNIPQGQPVAVGTALDSGAPVVRTSGRPRSASYARGRKKSSALPIVVGLLCIGAVVVAVLLFVLLSGGSSTVSNVSSSPPRTRVPAPKPAPKSSIDRFAPSSNPQPSPTEPNETPPQDMQADPLAPNNQAPENEPAPTAQPLSVAEIEAQAIDTALTEAREKLMQREEEAANRLLLGVNLKAIDDQTLRTEKEAKIEHLSTLQYYLKQFWDAGVWPAIRQKMEPGDSFEHRGDTVELVSLDETSGEVTYKFNGTQATSDPRQLPTRPALVFAWRSFLKEEEGEKTDPYASVFTATFLIFDSQSSLSETERLELAKQYWQEAADAGSTDKYVAEELGIDAS